MVAGPGPGVISVGRCFEPNGTSGGNREEARRGLRRRNPAVPAQHSRGTRRRAEGSRAARA